MAFSINATLNLVGPNNVTQIVNNINQQLKGIQATVNLNINSQSISSVNSLNSALVGLNNTLRTTQALSAQVAAALNSFGRSVSNVSNISALNNALNNTASSISSVATQAKEGANAVNSFGEQAGLAVRRFLAFSLAAGGIVALVTGIKQGIRASIDFETQLTRLRQVGDDTTSVIAGVSGEVRRLAVNFGVSSSDLVKAAVTIRQAGFSAEDTKKSLEGLATAALSPNFGNMEENVTGLVAAMRQFNLSAEQTNRIIGATNAVASEFAVEAKDIFDAVKRAGGVFSSLGGQFEEFISIFTSVRNQSQESAESIASGLRTIFGRLQRPETVDALKALQINLRYTAEEAIRLGNIRLTDNFVGPLEAVRRLSEGLRNLPTTDPRYANVVQQLGGDRQISKVLPLITQDETRERALFIAQTNQESATRGAALAQETLANKIKQTKEEFLRVFDVLTNDSAFQNFAKSLLTIAQGLAKVLEFLKPVLPLLITLGTIKIASSISSFLGDASRKFLTDHSSPGLRGLNSGGLVGYNRGGVVGGVGYSDTVPAALTAGEFVIRRPAAEAIGYDRLHRMNQGYADGGNVQKFGQGTENNVYGLSFSLEPNAKEQSKNPALFKNNILQIRVNENTRNAFNRDVLADFHGFIQSKAQLGVIDNLVGPQTFGFEGTLFESWIKKYLATQNNVIIPNKQKTGVETIDFSPGIDLQSNATAVKELGKFADLPENISSLNLSTIFGVEAKRAITTKHTTSSEIPRQLVNSFIRLFNRVAGRNEPVGPKYEHLYENIKRFIGGSNYAATEIKIREFAESLKTRVDSDGKKQFPNPFDLASPLSKFNEGGNTSIFSLLKKVPRIIPSLVSTGLLAVAPNDNDILEFLARKQTSSQLASISESIDRKQRISRGQGSISREDTVPALLTPGEFVFSKEATQQLGSSNLHYMNRMGKPPQGFNRGGFVGLATGTNQPLTQQNAGQLLKGFDFEIKNSQDFQLYYSSLLSSVKQLVDATNLTATSQEKAAIVTSQMVKYREAAVQYEKLNNEIQQKETNINNRNLAIQAGVSPRAKQRLEQLNERDQLELLPKYVEKRTLEPQLKGFYELGTQNAGVRLFGGQDLIAGGSDIAKPISRLESFLSRLDSKFGGGAKPPTAEELQSSFYKTQALSFVLPYISLATKAFVPDAEKAAAGTGIQQAAFFAGSAVQGGLESAATGGVIGSQVGQSIASIAPNIAKSLPVIGTLVGGFTGLVTAVFDAIEAFRKARLELSNAEATRSLNSIIEGIKVNQTLNLGAVDTQRNALVRSAYTSAEGGSSGYFLGIGTAEGLRVRGTRNPGLAGNDLTELITGFRGVRRSRGEDYLAGDPLLISEKERKRSAGELGAVEQKRLEAFREAALLQVRQTGNVNTGDLMARFYGTRGEFAQTTRENLNLDPNEVIRNLAAETNRALRSREASAAANELAILATNFKQVGDAAKIATLGLEGIGRLPSLFEGITSGTRQPDTRPLTELQGTAQYGEAVTQSLSGLNNPRVNQLRSQALDINRVNAILPEVLASTANEVRSGRLNESSINSVILTQLRGRLGVAAGDTTSPLARIISNASNLASREPGRFTDATGSITELVNRTQRDLSAPVDNAVLAVFTERMKAVNVVLGLHQAALQAQLDVDKKSVDIARAREEANTSAIRTIESQRGLRTGAISTVGNFDGASILRAILGDNANLSIDQLGQRGNVVSANIARINREASAPANALNPETQLQFGQQLAASTNEFTRLRVGLQEHINIKKEENRAIQERLGFLRQEREERHGLAERLLTGSPEEVYKLNRGIEVGRNLSNGGDIRNYSQFDIQAFFEAARTAGNVQFGFGSLAEIRNRTLSAIPGVGGVGQEERALSNAQNANNNAIVEATRTLSNLGNIPTVIGDTFTNTTTQFITNLGANIDRLLAGLPAAVAAINRTATTSGPREAALRTESANLTARSQIVEGGLTPAERDRLAEIQRILNNPESLRALERTGPTRLGFASGGPVYADGGGSIFKPRGTDTVPAMLTPGEFVVRKEQASANRGLLEQINKGSGSIEKAGYYSEGGLIRELEASRPVGGDDREHFIVEAGSINITRRLKDALADIWKEKLLTSLSSESTLYPNRRHTNDVLLSNFNSVRDFAELIETEPFISLARNNRPKVFEPTGLEIQIYKDFLQNNRYLDVQSDLVEGVSSRTFSRINDIWNEQFRRYLDRGERDNPFLQEENNALRREITIADAFETFFYSADFGREVGENRTRAFVPSESGLDSYREFLLGRLRARRGPEDIGRDLGNVNPAAFLPINNGPLQIPNFPAPQINPPQVFPAQFGVINPGQPPALQDTAQLANILERDVRQAEGQNFRNLARSSLLSQLAGASDNENIAATYRSQLQGQNDKQKELDERIKTRKIRTANGTTNIAAIFGQAAQQGGAGNFLNPTVAANYQNATQQRLGRGRQFARIRGFAEGGEVGGTDTVPAMLSPGEFVFSKSAVDNIGVNQLQRVHHYATGGPVGSASSAAGAATGGQDIIFDQFNKVLASATGSFDNLSGALSNFVQNSSNLVDALNSFPRNVSLEGRQTVEVILNGGEVLANIMPDIQTMIEKKTQQALRDTLSKSFPDINLGVENV